tara:strand:+ start:2271 stop:4397 length:2127 start_codon:yes stop_codon:yes gene_type:complete
VFWRKIGIFFVSAFVNFSLFADIDSYFPYKVTPSSSNYGNSGLFEIPNARFMSPASLKFSFSSSFPIEYTSITATPFSNLEATYRYAEIKNRKYGPAFYSGNQSFKDKAFDVKWGVYQETDLIPSIALGLRDIGGTGLFSSEYLVFSKKLGNFDITAGFGWGLLGSKANISNPLTSLSDNFKRRNASDSGLGGEFSVKNWFSGDTSLIGGLEYNLRKQGLRLKLEYDTSEPFKNGKVPLKPKTNFNFGLNYYPYQWLTLGVGYERGQEMRISFSFKGDFYKDNIPKPKPKTVIKLNKDQQNKAFEDKGIFYRSLNQSLRDESIFLQGAEYDQDKVEISIASNKYFSVIRPTGRAARIVSALASDEVEEIIIRPMNGDSEVARISLNRQEFDQANKNEGSASELLAKSTIESLSNEPFYKTADFSPTVNFPEFRWSMSPGLKHQIGGPEAFYLGQLYWRTDTSLKFARGLTLYTSIGLNIYDNFEFANPSFSQIPRVRSDIQEYLKEGKSNLMRMQMEYIFSPFKDIFVRADIGLLEEMFGGVGGQILYRPIEKRYAFGLSLHRVRQRGYEQRFDFKDYETSTGHLEFYSELANDIFLQAYLGKYLAGDKGITIDLSRRYKTGFVLGVFATKTNLSAVEFGEGSFDKGFYFSIPTKLFYPDFRSGVISFGLHPLTKDGGAFLSTQNQLFSVMGETNLSSLTRDWSDILD